MLHTVPRRHLGFELHADIRARRPAAVTQHLEHCLLVFFRHNRPMEQIRLAAGLANRLRSIPDRQILFDQFIKFRSCCMHGRSLLKVVFRVQVYTLSRCVASCKCRYPIRVPGQVAQRRIRVLR